MKKDIRYFILTATFIVYLGIGFSEEQKSINLPAPRMSGGQPLMEALAQRQSKRNFLPKDLPEQVLSNLLWAAFGINRPTLGKRTAPSASNAQEIDIYVSTPGGVFLYEAKDNRFKPVISEDIRGIASPQNFVKTAPVVLIYVADYRRMKGPDVQKDFYSATDTGFISQNVYLFCASEQLATVVLGMVDKKVLKEKMGLSDEQHIILIQPVGYPK